ncbi:MAG: UV damage endonuclease UvsE [Bacillota bacterium]
MNRNESAGPQLGLVCITVGPAVRYRTVTRTRYLGMAEQERLAHLRQLYRDNLSRLFGALAFCHANGIRLYRVTSALFPQIDDPIGARVVQELKEPMAGFGREAKRLGIRVVLHPDQYVVLNSESDAVVQRSLGIMERHAMVFDMLGLPRSSWSVMILHGGKGGRAEELVQVIRTLPAGVRKRLVLENDESAYGASAILDICHKARVPMVFDVHHHAIKERLSSYDDPSIAEMIRAAAATWPEPQWQIVHLSNGERSFNDPRHSELISCIPAAMRSVPWIEVEAKGKEEAIAQLRKQGKWPSEKSVSQ